MRVAAAQIEFVCLSLSLGPAPKSGEGGANSRLYGRRKARAVQCHHFSLLPHRLGERLIPAPLLQATSASDSAYRAVH